MGRSKAIASMVAYDRNAKTVPYLSLFSGGMGLDLGLERHGFRAVACNDIDAAAVRTIRSNRPGLSVIETSVDTITRSGLRKIVCVRLVIESASHVPRQS